MKFGAWKIRSIFSDVRCRRAAELSTGIARMHGRAQPALWFFVVIGALVPSAPGRALLAASEPAASVSTTQASPLELAIQLASQTESKARRDIAARLLTTNHPDAVQAVLTLLGARNNDPVKLALCEAIADVRCQETRYVAPLVALMQSREAALLLRKAAAGALAGYPGLSPDLVDKLKSFRQEQDALLLAENHAAMMKALHDCTPEADRAALLSAWLKQPLALERFTALDIVEKNLRKGPPGAEVLSQIRLLLADSEEAVRQKAVFVIRTLGQREDAPRLEAMLQQPQPAGVREAIYNALGVLGDPSSVSVVLAGLADESPTAAAEAATAIGRLLSQQPAPPESITGPAIAALIRLSEQKLADAVRERLIDAMATMGDARFMPILISHARSEESTPAVRQAAVRGLGRVGDPSVTSLLLERLAADNDAGVREAAAEALGKLGAGPEALPGLRDRLDPRIESAASVQAKSWDTYLAVFARLPIDDQRRILAEWTSTDASASARRIDLLTAMEKQATAKKLAQGELGDLREQLGDALIASSRPADAAPVLTRSLEALSAAPSERQIRVAGKMLDAYLATAPEKAIPAVTSLRGDALRGAVAARLYQHAQQSADRDPAAAADFIDRLALAVPDFFNTSYRSQFKRFRATLPIASRPATAAAG